MNKVNLLKQIISITLCVIMLFTCMFVNAVTVSANSAEITHTGNVYVESTQLRVRSGPGTSYTHIGNLSSGTLVYIYEKTDNNWYKIAFAGGVGGYGWVSGTYITNVQMYIKYDYNADFETNLEKQNFPESYKYYLRQLHTEHPNWTFTADHLSMTWEEAVTEESKSGISLVQNGYSKNSWKSMGENDYNWSTGNYIPHDSSDWVTAEREVVEYYMEPRNFLNENNIYLFLEQSYNSEIHTKEGLQLILNGTFMEGAFPEDTYATYADVLFEAAKTYGVSPYVLAASIIVEQGVNGQGESISGTVENYKNYYNYFNIGAFADDGYSAVQKGLIYAQGKGSYSRPWNTRAKSIFGGAEYYANGYVLRGQDTLYYKKFNVVSSKYYTHQYMTNIQAAYSEASKLNKAYAYIDKNASLSFSIPVYKEMPETNNTYLPTSEGANNYYITSLSVAGKQVENFSMYNNYFEVNVGNISAPINISATVPAGATVSGIGNTYLLQGKSYLTITVTAASGKTKSYMLVVNANVSGGYPYTDQWIKDDIGWCYFDSNGYLRSNQWKKDSIGWCYIGADGHVTTNAWVKDSVGWCYVGSDGYLKRTAWVKNGIDWCYLGLDGYMKTNSWIEDSIGWCYLDSNGKMATNKWVKDSVGWCYVGINGYLAKNIWAKDNVGLCYLDSNGRITKSKWIKSGTGWYYVGANGYRVVNSWMKDSTGWCYLDLNGRMVTNKWLKDSISWCYVGSDGYCVTNTWKKDSIGWCYLDSSGRMATNKWIKDSVGWCYVGSDGYCVTNTWKKDSIGWCYLDSNGSMTKSSWVLDGGKWYYMNSNGYMVTGKQIIDGKEYVFNSSGVWIS